MSWNTITQSDLKTKLSGAEYTALTTAAIASGQSDPVAIVITNVVQEIRGYIAGAGFALGSGVTIPARLQDAALTIIAWRAGLRLNVTMLLSDLRKAEYERALTLLDKLSDGTFSVEAPASADTDTNSGPAQSPSFTTPTPEMDPTSEDGI